MSALIDADVALTQLLGAARAVEQIECVDTLEAAQRVLAAAQSSSIAVPPMTNSAMDGYAVRVTDCQQPVTRLPIGQRIAAGQMPSPLEPGTAARIFTGAPLPSGADAVLKQEQCTVDAGVVEFGITPVVGENVRQAGEDIAQGASILASGKRLSAADVGLAASVGLAQLPVLRRLRVGLFSTGNELTMPGEPLAPGAIYNSNRFLLRSLLRQLGVDVTDLGKVQDSLAATREVLAELAEDHDLVITTGGVSVGEEDHVRLAVAAVGSVALWQIAVKPGKPLAFGELVRADGSCAHFLGLPGNPVSALVTFMIFARPFILRCQGVQEVMPDAYQLPANFDWPRPDRRREFLRVRRNEQGGLDLFPHQGSGVLTSVVWADGLVDNPPNGIIQRGDLVRFLPFSSLLS